MAKKAVKKKNNAETKSGLLDFIKAEMKDSEVRVVSTSSEDSLIPWKIPFKHIGLELATGGLLGGKIMEIQADSQAGKSFLAYELIAGCIEMGGAAFLQDPEQAYEPAYGEKIGIDESGFLYTNSTSLEGFVDRSVAFLEAARAKIKDKSIPLVIALDSFPALRTKEQYKADEEGKEAGYGAMKKNMKFYDYLVMIQPLLTKYAASLVIINQLRKDHTITYGDNTRSLAENMKYYCTQRIRGRIGKKIVKEIKSTETKVQTGMRTNWEIIKNRFIEPFKKVETRILFRSGLDIYSGLIEYFLNQEQISEHSKAVPKADGTAGKRQIKVYKVVGGTDKAYEAGEIALMLEENPSLLVPKFTKLVKEESVSTEVEEDVTERENEVEEVE